MAYRPESESDRYFSISVNHTINEHASIKDALVQKGKIYVIIDRLKKKFKPINGDEYRIPEFIFINQKDNSEAKTISINNWSIEDIEITYKSSSRIFVIIKISDPRKIIRNFNQEYSRKAEDVYLVLDVLNLLYGYIGYANWNDIDLRKENFELKESLQKLRNENDQLKVLLNEKSQSSL